MFERLQARDAETGGKGVAVLDIPLLVDVKAAGMFDFTLVVDASPEVQVERIRRDRGGTREEALARIKAQVPREERLAFADHVIHNEGSLDDLRREVDEAWEKIVGRLPPDRPGLSLTYSCRRRFAVVNDAMRYRRYWFPGL